MQPRGCVKTCSFDVHTKLPIDALEAKIFENQLASQKSTAGKVASEEEDNKASGDKDHKGPKCAIQGLGLMLRLAAQA